MSVNKIKLTMEFEVDDLDSFMDKMRSGIDNFIKDTKINNLKYTRVSNEKGYDYSCINYDEDYCKHLEEVNE